MTKSIWTLDPSHTLVEFSVKHMMIATVKGRFTGIEGTIEADPADLTTASITASVDVASVNTGDAQRDGHLRSADFFAVEEYPKLTFQSRKVTRKAEDEYEVTGDLTIRGVTREVTLGLTYEGQGKDPWGNERIGVTLEGKVNRKEFNLNWNVVLETGGILVGDDVKIAISAQAIKQAATAAAD